MLAYCDYIMSQVKQLLDKEVETGDPLINSTGPISLDLDPEGGWLVSSKKTMIVTDTNGKQYKVIVEELG